MSQFNRFAILIATELKCARGDNLDVRSEERVGADDELQLLWFLFDCFHVVFSCENIPCLSEKSVNVNMKIFQSINMFHNRKPSNPC